MLSIIIIFLLLFSLKYLAFYQDLVVYFSFSIFLLNIIFYPFISQVSISFFFFFSLFLFLMSNGLLTLLKKM